jgi:hypothetical protein
MRRVREYIARIDGGHWILLGQGVEGNWAYLVWGTEPLSGGLGPVAEQTAKDQVVAIAERHFAQDRANCVSPNVQHLRWQVAMELLWSGDRGQMGNGTEFEV